MKRLLLSKVTILLVAFAAVLCGCGKPAPTLTKPIKVGFLNIMAGVPLHAAIDQGHFAKEHLNVELIEFKTGNEVATAAISGSIDVIGGAALNAVLDASASSGKPVQIFLSNEYAVPGEGHDATDFLIARKEIATPADLKGKILGIYPGSVGRAFAAAVIPRLGLSTNDVKVVEIPAAQMLTALKAKTIDAVTALEPQGTTILQDPEFYPLIKGYYGQVMPRVPASGSWFMVGRLPVETERAFARALYAAVGNVSTNRQLMNRILVDKMSVPSTIVAQVRPLLWAQSGAPEPKQRLIEYLDFLQANALTSFRGSNWIWAADTAPK